MNRKLAYVYYCDFCRKATRSASVTSRHEKSCTKNPGRECRMCEAAELQQAPLAELLAARREDIANCGDEDDECGLKHVRPERLSQAANNCPACILAAMRLAPDDSVVDDWSFADAKREFWSNHNSERNPVLASEVL